MILYRVMSLEEFEAYKAGKTIRARNGDTVSKSRNSWRRPMICFFTSANNRAHWRPICAGNVIVALDVRNKKALERPGWGVYPDFTAAEQPGICDVLVSLMTKSPNTPCSITTSVTHICVTGVLRGAMITSALKRAASFLTCKVSMIYWRMKNERVKIHGQHRA